MATGSFDKLISRGRFIMKMFGATETITAGIPDGTLRVYNDGTHIYLQSYSLAVGSWELFNPADVVTAEIDADIATHGAAADPHAGYVLNAELTHANATGKTANDHHNESHTVPSHSGTPGGELGGTWTMPTVDATHSGSAHHAQSHAHSSHTGIGTDDHHAKSHASLHAENAIDELLAEGLGTAGAIGTVLTSDGAGGLTMEKPSAALLQISSLKDWQGLAEFYTGGVSVDADDSTNDAQYLDDWGWQTVISVVDYDGLADGDIDSLTDPGLGGGFQINGGNTGAKLSGPPNIGGMTLQLLEALTGKTYATIEIVFGFMFNTTDTDTNLSVGVSSSSNPGILSGAISLVRGGTNFSVYVSATGNDTGVAKNTTPNLCKLTINIAAATVDVALNGSEVLTGLALDTDKFPKRFLAGVNGTHASIITVSQFAILYKE